MSRSTNNKAATAYVGKHRYDNVFSDPFPGVEIIQLGDSARVTAIKGDDVLEERESIGKYDGRNYK